MVHSAYGSVLPPIIWHPLLLDIDPKAKMCPWCKVNAHSEKSYNKGVLGTVNFSKWKYRRLCLSCIFKVTPIYCIAAVSSNSILRFVFTNDFFASLWCRLRLSQLLWLVFLTWYHLQVLALYILHIRFDILCDWTHNIACRWAVTPMQYQSLFARWSIRGPTAAMQRHAAIVGDMTDT